MEAAVLGLPSGSHAQRVQAEFLKEFEARCSGVVEKPRGFGKPKGPKGK